MKNLYRILCGLSLVAIATVACKKVSEIDTPEPETPAALTHRVVAHAEKDITTKTTLLLPAGNQTIWSEEDKANMHILENGLEPANPSKDVDVKINENSLTIMATFPNTDATKYVYRSVLANDFDAATLSASIPALQELIEGNIDPTADILVSDLSDEFDASQSDVELSFRYARPVAINKITIKGIAAGDKIKSVTISSNKLFLGSFGLESETWTNSGNTLELEALNEYTISDESEGKGSIAFYFITAPVTDATLSIYVVTDKHVYEKDFTKTISFAANTVTAFATTVATSEVEVKTGTNDFIRVESTADLTAGKYVLIAESKGKAFNGFSTTSTVYGIAAPDGDVTIEATNGKIAKDDVEDSYIITLAPATVTEGAWIIKYGDKLFNWSSGNSLNSVAADKESANSNWSISITDGDAAITNAADNNRKLVYNASNPRFACYTTNQTAVQLYKKDEGGATKSALATPVVSVAKTETLDGIVVTWTDVTKAANYIVSCTGREDQTIAAGVQTCTFASLAPGTYKITVTANPENTSRNTASTSAAQSVEILDYQLVAPDVSFDGNTTTSIVATWDTADYTAEKAASYTYTILDGETVVVAETTVTTGTFEKTGLESNHSYTVKFKVNGKAPYKGTEYVSLPTKTLKESLKTIAEIKNELALGVTTYDAELTNAIITGKWDKGAFIEDATAGIYIYGEAVVKDLNVGDSYTGKVSGSMTTYKGQPELTAFDLAAGYTKTENVTLPLTEVSWATLLSDMENYDGKRVKILKGKLAAKLTPASGSTANITYGEHTLKVLSRATLDAAISSGTYVDVIGFPAVYDNTDEIIVTDKSAITESSITWQLKSISIDTPPTKRIYTVGDTFDPTGLVLSTVVEDASDDSIYKNGEDVVYAGNEDAFSFTPSLSENLTIDNTSVTISYGGQSTTQAITVNPAGGTPKYVKITSTDDLTDGQYLIVYESGNLAFDGGLETLDAESNTITVTISSEIIAQSTATDAAAFTYDATAHTLKSASGLYIGNNSNSNALSSSPTTAYTNTVSFDADGNVNIVSSGGAYLRYNKAINQTRFRYYKSSSYTGQQAIQLYKRVVN